MIELPDGSTRSQITPARPYSLRAFVPSCLRAFSLLAILTLPSCQSAHVDQPLANTLGGNDPDAQLEFWHTLAERPVTSNDDAFHGLLLFLDGEDPAKDYEGRVAELKKRDLLAGDFKQAAGQAVDRGTLAVAISKTLKIKGGLTMHVLGATPRYATKELVYLDIFPMSSPNQTFSGTEYLGIIGKMEDYQRQGAGASAPPEVGPEVNPARDLAPNRAPQPQSGQ